MRSKRIRTIIERKKEKQSIIKERKKHMDDEKEESRNIHTYLNYGK